MQYSDKLSEHYESLLDGKYDCVDRIILNAYCPMLTQGGGLRCWYRELSGEDKGLDTHKLISFAGTFSKRVQSYCKGNNIPFHHYKSGERKHEDAEALIPADKSILVYLLIITSISTVMEAILNAIRNGGCTLFTGAGFSVGAKNIENEPMPSGLV